MRLIGTLLTLAFLALALPGCASYDGYSEDAQADHHKSSRQRAFEPRGRFAPVADDILSGGL